MLNLKEKEIDWSKIDIPWIDFSYDDLQKMEKSWLPDGTLLRVSDDEIYMVGDAEGGGCDSGCGCCSDRIQFKQVAFLVDLLGIEKC